MRRLFFSLLVVVAAAVIGLTAYGWQRSQGLSSAVVDAEYVTPTDRFVDVAGATIRVREQGPSGAPHLLMIHGFTFSLESFDQLAEELDDEFRVVRYDLLGHGLTGPDPQRRYAPSARAAFAGEVIEALGLEKPVLVGNSLGGLVAWRLAASQPDLAQALILISPGAYPINGVSDQPAPVPGPVAAYLRTAMEPAVAASFTRIYGDPDLVTEERLALATAMMRREGNGDAFVESLERFTLPDPTEDLARVTIPALIVWGENDQVISPEHGPRIAAEIADARLLTYPGVGHVAQEESPGQLAEDIRQFLASIGDDPA